MNKKKWRKWLRWAGLGLAVAYVAIVVAGVYVWPNREPYLAEVSFGDGSRRMRLLHVGDGPVSYSWSDPRPRFIQLLTPRLIRKPHSDQSVTLDGLASHRWEGFTTEFESPAATFLLRPVDSSGEYIDHTDGFKGFHKRIELVDSTGFSFLPTRIEHAHPAPGILAAERTCVPRRDETLKISVVDQMTGTDPIELTIKNPFFVKDIPVWKGSALPQSVFFDDTLVILDRVDVTNLGLRGHAWSEGRNWRVEAFSVWFEDATGNRGYWLSPDEPAWKVHVTLVPRDFEVLPKESVIQLPPIEQPTAGNPVALNRTLKIGGRELRLIELSTDFNRPGESKSPPPVNQLVLKIEIPGSAKSAPPILCRTLDSESPRHVRTGGRRGGNRDGVWLYQFSLTRPRENAPVTIELGVGANREMAFMVTPSEELKTKMREHVVSSRVPKSKAAAGAMPEGAGARGMPSGGMAPGGMPGRPPAGG